MSINFVLGFKGIKLIKIILFMLFLILLLKVIKIRLLGLSWVLFVEEVGGGGVVFIEIFL